MLSSSPPVVPVDDALIVVEPLVRAQIDPSYPIIQIAMPEIGRAEWRQFAQRSIGAAPGRRGILTARRRARNFPNGLACYQCDSGLSNGRTLLARPVIAVDLLDPTQIILNLITGLAGIARTHGCRTLRVVIADSCDAAPLLAAMSYPGAVNGEYTLRL
ncbi:hypothetical protein [Acidiphilium sp.]|uniref:hypothetical protein n=1 Tax=Acidiphilium sp. TaxID=527 RepID=UPI003D084362